MRWSGERFCEFSLHVHIIPYCDSITIDMTHDHHPSSDGTMYMSSETLKKGRASLAHALLSNFGEIISRPIA